MKRILIPTDFSANSWSALVYTLKLFNNERCNFYILHVGQLKMSTTANRSFTFNTENLHPPIHERMARLFERISALSTAGKHHFIPLEEYGNFIAVLRKTVLNKQIELIALGTKEPPELKHPLLVVTAVM